jgi:tRNA U34 5-methylaminomethyl-2-thiouridine-forming methyltransferase MnmC
MKHEIIITKDGSTSIYIPEWDETYHSKFGAIQEAYHVFIKNGLDVLADASEISILEIGFGTGLNALITMLEAEKRQIKVNYVGVEAYTPRNWKYPTDKRILNGYIRCLGKQLLK